ncbi:MAG: MBL fold metallo-hydrolase [Bacteroidales bacterium]|nr:MBL fold metallo-hydrolase [Bacteroidales bacterium]
MSLNFYSLSSGSSGNCYYVGNEFHGILIDAGISARSVRKFLAEAGISMQTIMGVFVTHNHIDHTRGLEGLTGKNNIPAFATPGIWKSILPHHSKIPPDSIREIQMQQIVHLAGLDIEVFPVCHDAPETVGVHIREAGKSITIATDLGHVCPTAATYIRSANLLVIESNYDENMLLNGGYPPFLKARIQSDYGHLGNHQTSAFLAENMNGNLDIVCLAHLSRNNNTPELALGTLHRTLSERGISTDGDQQIIVLNRNKPTDIIWLR